MSTGSSGGADEDLTRHFRWRWNEHGIYLGVCSTLAQARLLTVADFSATLSGELGIDGESCPAPWPWAVVLPVGAGVQGDPVHQRLLPALDALAADSRRLESERRRGLAEGWPGEAARAEASLQTVVTSLHILHRTLDSATRIDRAHLDQGLLIELDQGLAAASAAARN
jgi:hypothetical protein